MIDQVPVIAEEVISVAPVATERVAYDIFLDDDGKYKAAVIHYKAESGEARIEKTMPVTRQLALIFLNHKDALKTLTKET